MPRVEVTLSKDGLIKTEAFDFEGESCEDATKFIDDLFGAPEEVEKKPEYYIKTTTKDCLGNGLCG